MRLLLGLVDDGEELEEILFLRDDMAAMAWAVEHQLQSDLDAPLDAYEMYLRRIKADPPAPPKATPGGPKIYYTLETSVPDNWIPMVPVQSPQNELFLRRGAIEIATSAGLLSRNIRSLLPTALSHAPECLLTAISVGVALPTAAHSYGWRARLSRGGDQVGPACVLISSATWLSQLEPSCGPLHEAKPFSQVLRALKL